MSRQRRRCCRRTSFAFQRAAHGARTSRRRFATASSKRALRALARALRSFAFFRRLQVHARSARLRQSDGNGLLRRARSMFAAADVMHLLAHELARLRARRLSLALIATRSL